MAKVVTAKADEYDPTLDVSAAFWGGLVGGIIFLLVKAIQPITSGNPFWSIFRPIAGLILGDDRQVIRLQVDDIEVTTVISGSDSLADVSLDWQTLVAGLILHFVLSIIFAFFITFILHRWGFLVGLLGGAALGALLYVINYYGGALLFPALYIDRGLYTLLAHVSFGAVAGGVYELLEERHAAAFG